MKGFGGNDGPGLGRVVMGMVVVEVEPDCVVDVFVADCDGASRGGVLVADGGAEGVFVEDGRADDVFVAVVVEWLVDVGSVSVLWALLGLLELVETDIPFTVSLDLIGNALAERLESWLSTGLVSLSKPPLMGGTDCGEGRDNGRDGSSLLSLLLTAPIFEFTELIAVSPLEELDLPPVTDDFSMVVLAGLFALVCWFLFPKLSTTS